MIIWYFLRILDHMKLSTNFIEFSLLLDRTHESICIDHNRKPVVGLNSQGGYTDRKEILELKGKKNSWKIDRGISFTVDMI